MRLVEGRNDRRLGLQVDPVITDVVALVVAVGRRQLGGRAGAA